MKKTALSFLAAAVLCGCITAQERAVHVKLKSIIIPQVDFRAADVDDVLRFLVHASREYDGYQKGVNIIWIPSPQDVPQITFTARDISIHDALNIVCDVGGLSWSFEDSVIKVRTKEK